MRWRTRVNLKQTDWQQWHRWYAWHPVLIEGVWVWLEYVARKGAWGYGGARRYDYTLDPSSLP